MSKRLFVPKGTVFGRLTVRKEISTEKQGRWFKCKCVCGKIVIAKLGAMRFGSKLSCGCLRTDKLRARSGLNSEHYKHGLDSSVDKSPLYRLAPVYRSLMRRCYNPSHKQYKDYGGRGIKVCLSWRTNMSKFIAWASTSGYYYLRSRKSSRNVIELDRRDNDKGYSPANCRWVTKLVNMNNRRRV